MFIVCGVCAYAQIDHDELQNVVEILVRSYIDQNIVTPPASTQSVVLHNMKKASLFVLQLIGVTSSLVGANIITKMLEAESNSEILPTTTPTFHTNENPDKIIELPKHQTCKIDYGCDRSVCWRTCGGTRNGTWCHTSPDPSVNQYVRCSSLLDCSPCWECLGACNT